MKVGGRVLPTYMNPGEANSRIPEDVILIFRKEVILRKVQCTHSADLVRVTSYEGPPKAKQRTVASQSNT